MNINYERFAIYYRDYYGDETEKLIKGLIEIDNKIALVNPFLSDKSITKLFSMGQAIPELGPLIIKLPKEQKPELIEGLFSHYFLDASSCLSPKLLPITPKSRVLDMCSAPGGKLLYLLSRFVPECFYVANDISKARMLRLRKMLNDYVPKSFQKSFIKVTNFDANNFGHKQQNQYDAILLDAPCSSEAHILRDPKKRQSFSGPQKSLPKRQYSLLCSALLALKPGGYAIYATCSINPKENQDVLKRLIERKSAHCTLEPIASPLGISDQYGLSVLPNLHGAGPAFLGLIRRT